MVNQEEILVTEILTILDGWKAKASNQEEKDVQVVIKKVNGSSISNLEQCQTVTDLLTKYPSFTDAKKLSDFAKKWLKLVAVKDWKAHGAPFHEFTEKLTQEWLEKGFSKEQCREWLDIGCKATEVGYCAWLRDIVESTPEQVLNEGDGEELRKKYQEYLVDGFSEDEDILPPWLFVEPKPTKPKPKPKEPKPTKPPLPKYTGPHTKCSLCEKRKFYSKAEFIQAHGINKLEPSCWVYTKTQPNKKELVFFYKWLCKFCKHEQHTNKCKYYSPPIQPVIPPEIFDWEDYWKLWFGVLTLDWESKRFFGKY